MRIRKFNLEAATKVNQRQRRVDDDTGLVCYYFWLKVSTREQPGLMHGNPWKDVAASVTDSGTVVDQNNSSYT